MQTQRRRDTACEIAIRSAIHRRGLRYTVDARPLPDFRRRADLVFRRSRVAVFVNGCFWHGCRLHGRRPTKKNQAWWEMKIERNRERDADTDRRLRRTGWLVIRVWEHESPESAAGRVEKAVRARTGAG